MGSAVSTPYSEVKLKEPLIQHHYEPPKPNSLTNWHACVCVYVQCRHSLKLPNIGKATVTAGDILVTCLSTRRLYGEKSCDHSSRNALAYLIPRSSAAQQAQRAARTVRGQKRHPHKQKWPEITTV